MDQMLRDISKLPAAVAKGVAAAGDEGPTERSGKVFGE
jgi:hypothetical protein